MKLHLKVNDNVFEYETRPMPERSFRRLCALGLAAVYAGMVCAVTALCGFWSLVVMVFATVVVFAFDSI